MESLHQHCGCVTPNLPGTMLGYPFCTLGDIPCLQRWKTKWYKWSYFDFVDNSDDTVDSVEQHNCKHCLPACDGVEFSVSVNVLPLRPTYMSDTYSVGIL